MIVPNYALKVFSMRFNFCEWIKLQFLILLFIFLLHKSYRKCQNNDYFQPLIKLWGLHDVDEVVLLIEVTAK